MIKSIPVCALFVLVFSYSSCKGQNKTELPKDMIKARISPWEYSSVTSSSDDSAKGVLIKNSFPKGGPYSHPTGKKFGRGIFWSRVINETDAPVELTIHFPADSFPVPPSPSSYVKLFLPPDTMTLEKVALYDYGAIGLTSFFDTSLNKSTRLQKTINPKEESLFYIAMLMQVPDNGPVRAGFVLKEQDLFYKISIVPFFDSVLIPCGHIRIRK